MSITHKSYLASVMREANTIKKAAKISRRDAMKKGYLVLQD